MSSAITYTTNHKYRIIPYSSEWPRWFTREAALLREIFGDTAIAIEHVGSTAVPGMAAKPQLDILLTVDAIEQADARTDDLKKSGYEAYGDALQKGGRLFSRWENGEKIVNLHVFLADSPVINEYIAMRDFLLAHPQAAKAYAALKLELYKKYPDDYLKYREFKDPFIKEMIGHIHG